MIYEQADVKVTFSDLKKIDVLRLKLLCSIDCQHVKTEKYNIHLACRIVNSVTRG